MMSKTTIAVSRETWKRINEERESGESMEEALIRAFIEERQNEPKPLPSI